MNTIKMDAPLRTRARTAYKRYSPSLGEVFQYLSDLDSMYEDLTDELSTQKFNNLVKKVYAYFMDRDYAYSWDNDFMEITDKFIVKGLKIDLSKYSN